MIKNCLLSVCILLFSVSIRSQQTTSLPDKKIKISELIAYLEAEFMISLSYSASLVQNTKADLDIEAETLDDILVELANESTIEFHKLSDERILLRDGYHDAEQRGDELYNIFVFDLKTKQPLELVAIQIDETLIGEYTDPSGKAILKSKEPLKSAKALFSLLGYESAYLHLEPGEKLIGVGLKPSPIELKEVKVVDRQPLLNINNATQATRIKMSELTGMVSSIAGNDLFRQIQLMSGVNAVSDASAGIKIRGGKGDETLIVLDGIPIYNATHYHGIFSAINSSFVESTSLFKNNMPIEYGGKTAGMLDINSKDLDPFKTTKGSLDINLLTTSLNIQHRISDKSGFILSGRTSYNNASETALSSLFEGEEAGIVNVQNFSDLTREVILNSIPDFSFNDVNFKFIMKPTSVSALDINFFRSSDKLNDSYSNQFNSRRNDNTVVNNELYRNQESWQNLGASINYSIGLSEKVRLQTTAFYSSYENNAITEASLSRRLNNMSGNQTNFANANIRNNHIQDLGFKSLLSIRQSERTTITAGLDIQNHNVDFVVNERTTDVLGLVSNSRELSLFSSIAHNFGDGWHVNAGLRGSYYEVKDATYWSPRLAITKHLSSTVELKASVGKQYQFVRELSFESVFGRTTEYWVLGGSRFIPVSSSNNHMIGGTWKKDRFVFDIEAYYRDKDGVVEFALVNPPFATEDVQANGASLTNNYSLFSGTGVSKGIDVSAGYNGRSFSSTLAYTWSKSTNSFPRILGGREFPAQDDRRHQLTLTNEYKVGDFGISANLVYADGRPYTDVANLPSSIGRDELTSQQRVSQLPHYARVDLGIQYGLKVTGLDAEISLSAFNLFNRTNVSYLQYIFSIPTQTQNHRLINTVIGTQTNQLARTINLGFSLKF